MNISACRKRNETLAVSFALNNPGANYLYFILHAAASFPANGSQIPSLLYSKI